MLFLLYMRYLLFQKDLSPANSLISNSGDETYIKYDKLSLSPASKTQVIVLTLER